MDGNAPEGFHVVLTTHNSRTSQRMRDRGIRPGPALLLPLDHEILLTQCIADVILESGFRCISYNICRDHVHMIIVCQHVQLVKVMQKIKSVLSKKFRRQLRERSRPMGHDGQMGHDPLGGGSASPRVTEVLPCRSRCLDTPHFIQSSGIFIQNNPPRKCITLYIVQ